MGLSDKLNNLSSPGRQGSDHRALGTPESWKPRMEVGSDGGYVISTPRKAGEIPDAKEILIEDFGLNPDDWIVTSIRKSRWQSALGEWLEACRVNLTPVGFQEEEDKADVESLIKHIQTWKPRKTKQETSGSLAFIFAPSDQQIGKKANGEGTQETVERILNATEGAVQRLNDLRRLGRKIGTAVIALLGDHVEGTVSQGGTLQSHAASDLGLTEQTRVARRVLMAQIKAFAPHVDNLIVAVVNGNHDEVTRQVKVDPSEGWNTEIASSVQDACAENEALSHVAFRYPAKDHQTLALDVCGSMLGLFHGHQCGKDVMKYLSEQAAGQTALGNSEIWLSGHYHNYKSMDIGSRFWIQCPTVDPGSAWFRDRHGLESNSGILTLVIGKNHDPRLDVSVIPARKNAM